MQQYTEEQLRVRNAFLAKPTEKTELVEYNGHTLEVRQPTRAVRGECYRAAALDVEVDEDEDERPKKRKGKVKAKVSFDMVKLQTLAIIACTYFPGTQTKAFNDLDYPSLAEQVAGGGADALGDIAMRLMNVKATVAEKKSETTQS